MRENICLTLDTPSCVPDACGRIQPLAMGPEGEKGGGRYLGLGKSGNFIFTQDNDRGKICIPEPQRGAGRENTKLPTLRAGPAPSAHAELKSLCTDPNSLASHRALPLFVSSKNSRESQAIAAGPCDKIRQITSARIFACTGFDSMPCHGVSTKKEGKISGIQCLASLTRELRRSNFESGPSRGMVRLARCSMQDPGIPDQTSLSMESFGALSSHNGCLPACPGPPCHPLTKHARKGVQSRRWA